MRCPRAAGPPGKGWSWEGQPGGGQPAMAELVLRALLTGTTAVQRSPQACVIGTTVAGSEGKGGGALLGAGHQWGLGAIEGPQERMQPARVTTHLPSPREAARPQRLAVRGAGIPALNFLSWSEVQKTGLPPMALPWLEPGACVHWGL